MPKDALELDDVLKAYIRLRRAERCVAIQRAMLQDVPRAASSYGVVLSWLKVSERALFSRRLEFEELHRERRQIPPCPDV